MLKFKHFPHQTDYGFEEIETIEGEGLRLYKTPYGNFPSMTSILSILDDGGVDRWKKKVGEEEAQRVVQEAVRRGNSLHDLSEKYLKNELTRDQLKGPGKVLFSRSKKYLDEIDLVIATEAPLYSVTDGYAGRTDAIVLLHDQITILDHKNSRNRIDLNLSHNRKKLWTYQLQCAGYARALKEMKGIEATQGCLIVGNHNTSTSDRFTFSFEDFERELDIVIRAYYNNGMGLEESKYFSL